MAKDTLVTVYDTEESIYHDFVGIKYDGGYSLEIPEVDWNRGAAYKKQRAWICDWRDRQAIVNTLSENFPASEILVFRLNESYQRIVGELIPKQIDANGILPA